MAKLNDRSRGGFSPEAKALFSRAEKFHSTTVQANAARWELHDRASNQGAMREAAKLGFTGIEVDRERGGLGLGTREKLRVTEILGRSSLSFALGLLASQNAAVRLSSLGSARHRTDLLPGLLAGTRFGAVAPPQTQMGDAASRSITAVENPSGWILSGDVGWIVNAAVSDVFVCYADTGSTGAAEDLACFVVRSGQVGFKLAQPYRLVAGAPIGVGGFELSDYQCLDADMLVGPGDAVRIATEDVNCQRLEVAVLACVAVRSSLASTVEHLGQASGVASRSLADVATSLEAAEALTSAAVDHYCVERSTERTNSLVLHAKQFACGIAEQSIASCLHELGRGGLLEAESSGRLLAECRVLGGLAGSSLELQQRVLEQLIYDYSSATSADSTVTLLKTVASIDPVDEDVVDLRDPGADSLSSWASPKEAAAGTSPIPPMPPSNTQLTPARGTIDKPAEASSDDGQSETDDRTLPPMPPPGLRREGP